MTDSVTNILLNRGAPKMSLCDLPAEMLWSICSHSNLVSLMRLSATCSAIRSQVHAIFTSRISAQAVKYPEVRLSLDRLGWKKKHNFWDCNCFKLIAGPLFTWSHLQEHRDFSVVCEYNLSGISATAAGKLFFMTSDREINYRQIAPGYNVGHNSLRTLVKFNDIALNLSLVTFDNVLAVCFKRFKKFIPHEISVIVYVFNASSLVKVSEMNLYVDGDGISVTNRGIYLTRDTMVVHLEYNTQGERETKIQIWKLNTNDPQEEGIELLYTISHENAVISKQIRLPNSFYSICVNDRFIVIFDTVVKVFTRSEENPLVGQIQIENTKRLSRMAIQGGQGDHLALLLEHLDDNNVLKLTVSVYSASRGDLLVRKEFNAILRWNSPFYMTWFGDHLIIGSQEDYTLSLFTWQPGLTSFLNSPFQVPVARRSPRRNRGRGTFWIVDCLMVDFQGINTAVYDELDGFFRKMVHFKTWK